MCMTEKTQWLNSSLFLSRKSSLDLDVPEQMWCSLVLKILTSSLLYFHLGHDIFFIVEDGCLISSYHF